MSNKQFKPSKPFSLFKPRTWNIVAQKIALTFLIFGTLAGLVAAIGHNTLVNDYLSRMTVTITGGRRIVTAIDNIAIGGTTPVAGAFTTLSASSTLNVTGAATFSGGVSSSGTDTVTVSDATSNVVSAHEIIHETSVGTPTVGIGVKEEMTVETTASNNEKIVVLEAVTIDVTAGSEDAKYVIKVMGGGATAVSVAEFGTDSLNLKDKNVVNVGDIALDSLSADGANIMVSSPIVVSDSWSGGTETITLSSDDPGVGTASLTKLWSGIVSDATGSGTDTCSLLDGVEGQIKMFTLTTDGETTGMALTPVNFGPGTDILFEDVNDGCTLIFAGGAWQIITNTGGTVR